MEQSKTIQFNDQIRERTLKMSVGVRNLLLTKKVPPIDRDNVNQLIRSASSTAANYRAATRGRSDQEFYSKICIVVEEMDETHFWLEYFIRCGIVSTEESSLLTNEIEQLVRLFSTIKKKMKLKLEGKV
jgi:four helix bundle protein